MEGATLEISYREFMTAQTLESDLDFAFHLQLQESLDASLTVNRSEPDKFELDRRNRLTAEEDWEGWADVNNELQFGEGSSSSAASSKTVDRFETFRVYFKSFVQDAAIGGIGIAICDSRDNLIFKLGKPMPEIDRIYLGSDCLALIEALNFAISLNLTRVEFYYDCFPLFQYVQGRWNPKQSKLKALVNQVSFLRNKFEFINELYVGRNDIKHAFKLAREAVDAQINNPPEICVICFDNKPNTQIFQTDSCSHRYCFSCMTQHVEMKLLNGCLPKCPHEECNSELKIEDCKVFLPANLIEIMSERMNEASIPATEKVYCPFPKCSALMSRKEIKKNLRTSTDKFKQNGARQCIKCENIFCIRCKVSWHKSLSCYQYKRLNPDPPAEELKLKKLADANLWRQCEKCSNMIELALGCYHITCRCGYEFCYTCGAEWKDKKATCSCPLWDEQNLVSDDELLDEDGDYYLDDEEDDYEYVYMLMMSIIRLVSVATYFLLVQPISLSI